MIRTKFRVEDRNVRASESFAAALTEWELLPWVKYLREHGNVSSVETFDDFSAAGIFTVYLVTWELPAELETYFYLIYDMQ